MIRFGRPLAAVMCQPLPPTLVAKPTLNTRCRLTGSQSPQNPTYALLPSSAAADAWLGASVSFSDAPSLPGCECVPRSNTCFQSVSLGTQLGSPLHGDVVSGPERVSSMLRPATRMCLASRGSMTSGATKSGSSSSGSMLVHVDPPSVETFTPAFGSSS